MATLIRDEQHAPLDADQPTVRPTGPVPAVPNQLERWHKRTIKTFIARIKPTPPHSRNPRSGRLTSRPATIPLATTDALRPTEQQEENERTRERETRINHELMLQVRIDEEELFESDALQNWLNAYVGSFLSRNNRTDRDAPFWSCLKTYDTTAYHERSQYIAVHLTSDAIRHKSDLADELMQATFSRNRENFEIKVFGVSGLELKGYVQMNESTAFDDRHSMQISLSGTMNTLCGAQITLTSNRLEPATDPLVWTCGGLISVEDRIYALTVSHPLESQRHGQGKSDPEEYHSGQALSNQAWGDFGQIAALAASDSRLGPNNNDWMLLEVKKHMQLPNISFHNNLVKADIKVQSVSHDADRMRGACKILTSRGVMAGTIVQGSSYLKFGSITLRTLQVLIEQPLGMLAITCHDEKKITNKLKFKETLAAGSSREIAQSLALLLREQMASLTKHLTRSRSWCA